MEEVFDHVAGLLDYPGPDFRQRLQLCRDSFTRHAPREAERHLEEFASRVENLPQAECEELYTGTFDLNPVCSLEVGWHLYGENYARGEFLVHMRKGLRQFGVEESTELPDHLTLVLALLARLSPQDAGALVSGHVEPALDRMLAGLAGKDNPFEHLIRAIRALLGVFPRAAAPMPLPAPLPHAALLEEAHHD